MRKFRETMRPSILSQQVSEAPQPKKKQKQQQHPEVGSFEWSHLLCIEGEVQCIPGNPGGRDRYRTSLLPGSYNCASWSTPVPVFECAPPHLLPPNHRQIYNGSLRWSPLCNQPALKIKEISADSHSAVVSVLAGGMVKFSWRKTHLSRALFNVRQKCVSITAPTWHNVSLCISLLYAPLFFSSSVWFPLSLLRGGPNGPAGPAVDTRNLKINFGQSAFCTFILYDWSDMDKTSPARGPFKPRSGCPNLICCRTLRRALEVAPALSPSSPPLPNPSLSPRGR